MPRQTSPTDWLQSKHLQIEPSGRMRKELCLTAAQKVFFGVGKKGYRSGMLNPSSAIQAEKLETQAENSSIVKQRLESHSSR